MYAPESASCMFCANTCTREPRVESTIACSAVYGGQIATSTPSAVATCGSSAAMNASASAIVLCIFQLPAMNGVRLMTAPPPRAAACPRSSSSDAPPPVDMWSTWSARPNWAIAAAESPPPTTVVAELAAIASATARVPAANGASSNAPIGPFQNTVPADLTASA